MCAMPRAEPPPRARTARRLRLLIVQSVPPTWPRSSESAAVAMWRCTPPLSRTVHFMSIARFYERAGHAPTARADNDRMPTDLFEEIVRLRAAGEPAALCTVLLARGSTPGKETMKMLVRADGSTVGSVGGGCVEADVVAMARTAILTDRSDTRTFRLTAREAPESGLICGGQVTILVEPITPPVLVLFGAGHVAETACRMAKEVDLRVIVADPRDDYANTERFPSADTLLACPWPEAVAAIAPAEHHYLVVVTRGHEDDAEVVRRIHEARCRPKYLGMIGSRAKRETLDRMLRDEGVADSFLAAIKTPIGLDLGAATHAEIALSLVAELVQLRRSGA